MQPVHTKDLLTLIMLPFSVEPGCMTSSVIVMLYRAQLKREINLKTDVSCLSVVCRSCAEASSNINRSRSSVHSRCRSVNVVHAVSGLLHC